MPNRLEREPRSHEPHARPGSPAAGRSARAGGRSLTVPGGAAGVLRSRAGVGLALVALVASALALTGFFAMPNRSPDSVAAGATRTASPAPVQSGLVAPSSSPSGGVVASIIPFPSASTGPSLDPLAGVPVARLQQTIDAFQKKTGIPGLSVAIVWNDGRAWAGASGRADVARRVPMTTGTAFAFASVSKTFTAAVVMQLIDEGKVGLDQSAAELLPAYGLDRRITVRMLLDHRSSLPDFFGNVKIDRALQQDKSATWTPARTWSFVPRWRPTPGTVWDYSNTNYLLLGELVERVTGHPLAVEIRNRLLDPLQLATAWYQGAEDPLAPGTTGYRLYRTSKGARVVPVAKPSSMMPFRSVVTAAGGAGSIAGTATDAARWMQAYGSGRVVSDAMYRAMLADSKLTKAMHARVAYGLGVQLVTIEKQPTLGHSGRYIGFQNAVRYLTGPGISIAILTNQNTWDPALLMRQLVKIVAPVT